MAISEQPNHAEHSPQSVSEDEANERRRFARLLLAGAITAYAAPFPYVLYQFLVAPAFRHKPASPLALGSAESLFVTQNYIATKLGDKNVMLLRSADGIKAFNLRCTHAGCTVEWQPNMQKFVCHCHGGEFHADGSVAKIPPTKPLEELTIKHENGQIVVYDAVMR